MGIRTAFNPIGNTCLNSFVYSVIAGSNNCLIAVPMQRSDQDSSIEISIDWGDGNVTSARENFQTVDSYVFPCHTYASAGEYIITLTSGTDHMPYLRFGESALTRTTLKRLISCDVGFYSGANQKTDVSNMFLDCVNLEGTIPTSLFAKSTGIKKFYKTFYNCSKLSGDIPANLFSNNRLVTDFSAVFGGCSGLDRPIPGNLFSHNPNAANFQSIFNSCSSLPGPLPAELFKKCPKATQFSSAFYHCSNLNCKVPDLFFAYNPLARYFVSCFYKSSALPSRNMFCDEESKYSDDPDVQDRTTRFAGKSLNFTQMFMRDSVESLAEEDMGTAPALWTYTYGTVTKTRCFKNCNGSIDNYGEAESNSWV